MTYETLVRELLAVVPELEEAYQKELEWWGQEDPGAHNVFGDVLFPHLADLLRTQADQEALKRIFGLFNKMAVCEDIKVKEVLAYTILEKLGDDRSLLRNAEAFMDANTMRMSEEVERFWGRS